MRRIYQAVGASLVLLYAASELMGWELSTNARRGVVAPSARNAAGYRTWHFWNGGK